MKDQIQNSDDEILQAEHPPHSTHGPSHISNVDQSILSQIRHRDPLMFVLFAIFGIISYVFYTTDFRRALENFFYDIRITLMHQPEVSSDIIVIAIDDKSIDTLEKDQLRARTDGKKRPYLSIHSMTVATSILANSDALAIALLMPEHAFPAADLDMDELKDIVKYDHRIILGTTGYNQTIPNLGKLPPVLFEINDQVAGYETFRSRSNAIVRSLPYTSYRGLEEIKTLPTKIVEIVDPNFGAEYGSFTLKHHHPMRYPQVSMSDFIASPQIWMDQLKGKIVIVGYTMGRDAGFQTTELMIANTPLTGAAPNNATGISTTWLTANAIDNLLHRDTIESASGLTTLIQTVVVAILCGLSWELGSLTASITTILIWALLIAIHSLFYQWFSLSIPLADTFLTTVLVTVFAAIRRLKFELKVMAEKEADSSAKSEIAAIQSHFLAGFASWLKNMTQSVVDLIRESSSSPLTNSSNAQFYQRAFSAGEDFAEYLEAIRQIPEMESISNQKIKKSNLNTEEFIKTILRRFEIKRIERNLVFDIDIDVNSSVIRTNQQLLDAIIFNFISNAIKYGPTDSKIIIKSRKTKRGEFYISVIDQGPGIPPELKERIFERFYRIRDDRIYNAKGTGLGLYLCRFFAEKLAGRIEVFSEVNQGSEFRVVLK